MADNLTTQSATPATIPASTVISTDDAGADGHIQRVKLSQSADGVATPITADADGLLVNLGANNDVTVASLPLPSGASTSAKQDTQTTALQAIQTAVEIIDNFISGSKGLVTEDNSAAILTAVQTIDNFISGARGLVTEDNSASILAALQTIDNFISGSRGLVTEDNSAAALVALQAIQAAVQGTLTVGSHAVTNAGTFAVQVDGAALTSLQLIDDAVYTDGSGTPAKALGIAGTDGTNPQIIKTDTEGELQVDVLSSALPTGASTAANQTTMIGHLDGVEGLLTTIDADTSALAGAVSGTEVQVDIVSSALPTGAATAANQLPDGHNVTVDNSTGAAAVNIQDGGNSITVDNGGTFAVQESGAALTALQLLDDTVFTDDNPFTAASSKVLGVGAKYDVTSPDSVDEDDIGILRMSANRSLYVTLRDAAGNERGLNVDSSGRIATTIASTTSITPGTAATNLGKAEDAAHTSGDVGVMAMTVRQDTAAALSGANADYQPLITDANGRLHVLDANTANISTQINTLAGAVSGTEMQVDVLTLPNVTIGAAIPAGTNNIGDVDVASGTLTTLTTLTGGGVAHDGADSGNPVKVGAKASATLSDDTMVADADRTDMTSDLDGALYVRQVPLGDVIYEALSNTDGASTASTNFGATANTRNYITNITAFRTDTGTTLAYIDFRDGTGGSVIYRVPLPPSSGVTINNGGLPLFYTTANTALAYDVSSALTTVYISLSGFKSKARA